MKFYWGSKKRFLTILSIDFLPIYIPHHPRHYAVDHGSFRFDVFHHFLEPIIRGSHCKAKTVRTSRPRLRVKNLSIPAVRYTARHLRSSVITLTSIYVSVPTLVCDTTRCWFGCNWFSNRLLNGIFSQG